MAAAPCQPGELIRLTPSLWRLTAPNAGPMTGPGTNTYFFGSPQGVVVVDPGPADSEHVSRIAARAPGPIEAIAVTHTHRDHSPGATLLAAATGAPLAGMPPPATPENDHGFAPAHVLSDGDRVELADAGALVAFHTPGHASNHLCYLTPDGILLTGDHIMQGSTVVILPPDGDMQAYIDSLERVKSLHLRAIAPGHGTLIGGPYAEIERLIAHRWARDGKVADAVAALQPCTIDAVLPVVYDNIPSFAYPLARRSLEAHLIRLREAGAVAQDGERWCTSSASESIGECL